MLLSLNISYYVLTDHLKVKRAATQPESNTRFNYLVHNNGIDHHNSETRRLNENTKELVIREFNKRFYIVMTKNHIPKKLCDYVSD